MQGRNHSPPFKLKGRSFTHFHYYIVLPGYGYNGNFCGHGKIAVGVHWMEFVSHVKSIHVEFKTKSTVDSLTQINK